MSFNLVVLTGRLGKDPELKTTNSGKSVTSFGVALDEGYGEKKKTIWVNVEAWDKTAEAINRLSGKGKRVTVRGRLSEDVWEQNGEKKSRFKVVAQDVDILDFKENGEEGYGDRQGEF